MSAGLAFTCALRSGALWCWGYGLNGRLGTGDTAQQHAPVQIGSATDWVQVTAGYTQTCGRRSDTSLWCWGQGSWTGTGTSLDVLVPTQVGLPGLPTGWVTVDAGHSHTCALQSDGTLYCWGSGLSGALGQGNVADQPLPVAVTFP